MYDGYSVHCVDDETWQVWKNEQLIKKNFGSSDQAWQWLENKLFPVELNNIPGFKAVKTIR